MRQSALDSAPNQSVYLPQAAFPTHYSRLVARIDRGQTQEALGEQPGAHHEEDLRRIGGAIGRA